MDCVIYTRVSIDRTGEALAVTRQEQECRALADRLGLKVMAVHSDNDISATSGKARPGFEAMLKTKPTAIIAWHQDRLLRLTRDLERVITLNVPVYTVTAGTLDLTTPAGRAVARTVAAWSQYEGEQKATRQVAANVQRAANGVRTGRVGYGYRRAGTTVVLDDAEAATIRSAVRRVLHGESLRAICKDLDAQGIPTPGRGAKWNSTTLKQLLLRPSLAGLTVHRGQVVGRTPDDSPRVIDEDTHERLKAALTDPVRRTAPVGRAPKYLLGGIARCGRPTGTLDDKGEPVLCGGVMVRAVGRKTTTKSGGTKRQPPSYVCSACYRVRRIQDLVDKMVEGIVVGRLEMPDAAQLFATGDPVALQEARDSIEAIDARLTNAADMFAAGTIDAAQLTRITERLRADRAQAATALDAALPPAIPADLIGANAGEVWHGLSMDVKRAVMDTLVTVTILPSGSGKAFDPDTVQVVWRS
ncbi:MULTISPECIES: recombinase family protein [Microbacterium]|uniref:recombinase family protein n=1 Tax=Microbacterium TaxID=33882 RepID=UPI000F5F94F5|nr:MULTISPECIES: recombinase family protein [Microbacterium]AZH79144.1 serine recombinase [Microbacterium sp. Y-01]MBM7464986.1 DNA invertase Pin-like site-specific DNA recombinase [Microbacterium esteraromaticum]